MTRARVATFNVSNYDPFGKTNDSYTMAGTDRQRLIPEIIKGLQADVVLLQNMYSSDISDEPGGKGPANALWRLAIQTGMQYKCMDRPVVAQSEYTPTATGILWTSRFKPQAWQARPSYWHPLVHVKGEIEGKQAAFASGQGMQVRDVSSAGADLRVPEAMRTAALAQLYDNTIVGLSAGNLSAARAADGEYIDPDAKPMTDNAGHICESSLCYCKHINERNAGHAIERGGLVDVAAQLAVRQGVQPVPTVMANILGVEANRLDYFYAVPELASHAISVDVIDSQEARMVSEHHPVVLTYDLP